MAVNKYRAARMRHQKNGRRRKATGGMPFRKQAKYKIKFANGHEIRGTESE